MTSKRKTKQLRWLVTGLMLAMTMVMPASTWAKVMYTVYDNGTLTFKYGDKQQWSGIVYDVPNDPTNPTNPGWIIDHRADITTVVFDESFKNARPTSCYDWFHNCSNLTSIKNIKNLYTYSVTDMSFMFYGCKKLTSLDLSSFNTANVKNMMFMFFGCSGLTSLNLSSFNTANVKNMIFMFNGCRELTDLTLSSFNTANVTNMMYMFYGCKKLKSLNLSNFNTANVTNMNNMFYGCGGLTALDLSSFNTANVTDMSGMFNYCSGLISLNLSNFNTDNVTDMSGMFWVCSGLTSLDVSKFNTAKVTNMMSMFNACSDLTSLDLSSFNTAKVENMSHMFYGCSGLTTIYVSDDFKTGNGSSSDKMFSGCSKLVGAASYSEYKTGQSMANYNTGYFKTYYKLGENQVDLYGVSLTTESLDLSREKDFVAHAPFTANTAKYSRDLSSSNSTWFSLCLPFAYTPQNFTAYQLKGATDDAVEIGEISGEIVAGTPVLFKFKDGVKNEEKKINISAKGANIVKAPVDGTAVTDTDGSSLQLCGTYQTKTFSKDADGNAFILLNDKLMNPAKMLDNQNVSKVSVKPFRAYMTLTAPAQTSSARAFSIGRGDEGDEGTSAIDLLNSVATDDAEYYDINGRRIDAPVKGVNIVRRGNKTIKLIIK
ncbi:MAG: BspA family leucine-rich repeat surface protein [Prevotella sp.]|nr:BspA family leucine-rich repeat surface protein [Prevotella sp.]